MPRGRTIPGRWAPGRAFNLKTVSIPGRYALAGYLPAVKISDGARPCARLRSPQREYPGSVAILQKC